MKLTIIPASLALLLATGCASNKPTLGDIADERGDRYNSVAEDYRDGTALVKKGRDEIKSGEKLVKKGRKEIKSGKSRVSKGEKLLNRARQTFEELEED